MKLWVVFLLLAGFSTVATGYPRHAFLDLPIAVPLGDAGLTYFQARFEGEKSGFIIARSIRRGIDIFAPTTLKTPFSLGCHVMLLQDLGPLSVAIDVGSRQIQMAAGLLLGPVRVDWGRVLSREGSPWAILSASPTQYFTLVIGVERIGGTFFFLGGARLYPFTGTWGVSLLFRQGRFSVAAGGFF